MWLSNSVSEVPVVSSRLEVRRILQYHKGIRLHHVGTQASCNAEIRKVIKQDGFYDGVILIHNNKHGINETQLWW